MTYDSRAFVYCNLGDVISGQFQESSPESGLIMVSGSCVLAGIHQIVPGSRIEFAYYKNNTLARLGRSLYVLGGAADPTQRTTAINFGCKLKYNERNSPGPVILNGNNDPDTPQLSEIARAVLLQEITARFIATECLSALGIAHGDLPLTNTFYREEYRIDGPYLDVLADVLISENYAGYMDENDVLQLVNLAVTPSRGPVLSGDNIISLAPATPGEPLPTGVYSTAEYKAVNVAIELRDPGGYGGGTSLPGRPATPPGIDGPNPLDSQSAFNDQISAAEKAYLDELERIQKEYQDGLIDAQQAEAEANQAGDDLNNILNTVDNAITGTDGSNPDKVADEAFDLPYFNSGSSTPLMESTREWRWEDPDDETVVYTESRTWLATKQWTTSYGADNKVQASIENTVGPYGTEITETVYSSYESETLKETTVRKTTYKSGAFIAEACKFADTYMLPLGSNYQTVGDAVLGLAITEYTETITSSAGRSSISSSMTLVPQALTSDGAAMCKNYSDSFLDRDGVPLPGVTQGVKQAIIQETVQLGGRLVVSGGEVRVENSGKRAIPKGPTREDVAESSQAASGKTGARTPAQQALDEIAAEQARRAEVAAERLEQEAALRAAKDEEKKAAIEARNQALQEIKDARRAEKERQLQEEARRREDLINQIDRRGSDSSYSGDRASGATYTYNVEVLPELFFVEGSGEGSGIYVNYTPPLVPDDRVVASNGGYYVVRSDASNKVTAYARTQYKLLAGRNQGFNVVYPVENYNTPCQALFLDVAGVSAQFRATETTIAFDSSGVLMSSIALLEGATGQATPPSSSPVPNPPAPSIAYSTYSINGQEFSGTGTITWQNVESLTIVDGEVRTPLAPGATLAPLLFFDYEIKVNGVVSASATGQSALPPFSASGLGGATVEFVVSVPSYNPGQFPVAELTLGPITIAQVT